MENRDCGILGQWRRRHSANSLLKNSSSSPATWPAPAGRLHEGSWAQDGVIWVQRQPRCCRHLLSPYRWPSSNHGIQECELHVLPARRNYLCRELTVTWKVNWKIWRPRSQTGQSVHRSQGAALPSRNAVLPRGHGAAPGELGKGPGKGRDACACSLITLVHVILSNCWPSQP